MYPFRLTSELHPQRPRPNRRCRHGWVLPMLAVLTVLYWADPSWASCSHYVQDRLHPAGTEDRGPLEFTWLHSTKDRPCQGPECRAPQLPAAPTGIAVVIGSELVRVGAVSAQFFFSFEHPARPRFARPRSDLMQHSPINSILKPPC
jgi:hypothetical protein